MNGMNGVVFTSVVGDVHGGAGPGYPGPLKRAEGRVLDTPEKPLPPPPPPSGNQ